MCFIHAVPIDDDESFGPLLEKRMKCFFDMNKKRKTDFAGKATLDCVCSLPQGTTGGLGKFFIKKGGGDPGKATVIMTEEIVECCSHGCSLQCDVPHNRFMVDCDTKEFLTKHVGISSWDDLSKDHKEEMFQGLSPEIPSCLG